MKVLIIFLFTLGVSLAALLKPGSRIVSGQKAGQGEIPWQVILSRKPNKGFFCGGSIISSQWVLTAAHCTKNRKSINLSFGSVRLKDIAPISMVSEEFVQHPNYDAKTLQNDISLIKLPTPLTFSDDIKPIQLISRSQASNLFLGKTALISGFGFTNDEILNYSNDLLYAFVEIVPNKVCTDIYGPNSMISSGICAKGAEKTNQNVCSGDSGGALVYKLDGENVQIGINSYAAEYKCTQFYPSGYARVGSFLDFISKETGIAL